MFRRIVIWLLLMGVPLLTSCAESFHQIQREAGALGIPPDLETQVDRNVSFADLQTDAETMWGELSPSAGSYWRPNEPKNGQKSKSCNCRARKASSRQGTVFAQKGGS